jgi:hypothetical protein
MNKKNTNVYLLFATITLFIAVLLIRQKTSSSVDDNVRKIDEVANTPIAAKSARKDNASTKVSSNKIADSLSNSKKLEQLKTEWLKHAKKNSSLPEDIEEKKQLALRSVRELLISHELFELNHFIKAENIYMHDSLFGYLSEVAHDSADSKDLRNSMITFLGNDDIVKIIAENSSVFNYDSSQKVTAASIRLLVKALALGADGEYDTFYEQLKTVSLPLSEDLYLARAEIRAKDATESVDAIYQEVMNEVADFKHSPERQLILSSLLRAVKKPEESQNIYHHITNSNLDIEKKSNLVEQLLPIWATYDPKSVIHEIILENEITRKVDVQSIGDRATNAFKSPQDALKWFQSIENEKIRNDLILGAATGLYEGGLKSEDGMNECRFYALALPQDIQKEFFELHPAAVKKR